MRILITGAKGFIGKNVALRLSGVRDWKVLPFTRENDATELPDLVAKADAVIHLAGINRASDPEDMVAGNKGLTDDLCRAIDVAAIGGRGPRLIHASSIHAGHNSDYGMSKLAGEQRVRECIAANALDGYIFRLPNVFGKWCRPGYNSVVATFCHNIAHGLPIHIDDPDTELKLVHIDDVVEAFVSALEGKLLTTDNDGFALVAPVYRVTLKDLAAQIQSFRESRTSHVVDRVGTGLTRALYATYLTYLEPEDFSYPIQRHNDHRGTFAEMLRTKDSGQISFFTAGVGVTRGGHFHNAKSEKFLVIKGRARFRSRHLQSGEFYEVITDGHDLQVVESVPGWAHDITNIGDTEIIVLLWANEQFDPARPDTYPYAI